MLSPAVVGNFWTFLYQPQIGLFNYLVSFFTGIDPSSFQMIGDVNLAPWSIIIVDTWMWAPYVMLICLAGLRSIPDYIYEAAEVDRASPWRQFWSITLPMVLPFLMLAVLFRAIENFKMFDMVVLLTSGGPGSTTELASITSSARRSRSGAPAMSALCHHPVRDRVRRRHRDLAGGVGLLLAAKYEAYQPDRLHRHPVRRARVHRQRGGRGVRAGRDHLRGSPRRSQPSLRTRQDRVLQRRLRGRPDRVRGGADRLRGRARAAPRRRGARAGCRACPSCWARAS